jgi:hypothetical protein
MRSEGRGNNSKYYRNKSRVAIVITATIVLLIAVTSTTTMIVFPNVNSALATPLTSGTTEQVGNDTNTTTATDAATSPTVGQEQQEQQPIHIIKDGTTSYAISGGSSRIGSFDTTYRIAGENGAVRASEDLIISTITSDYSSSPIIGYVIVGNTTSTTTTSAGAGGSSANTLPNPFATPEQITERIASELRRVIGADGNNNMTTLQEGGQQQPMMEIKCIFGMELDDMRCDNYIPSVGAMEDEPFDIGDPEDPPEEDQQLIP